MTLPEICFLGNGGGVVGTPVGKKKRAVLYCNCYRDPLGLRALLLKILHCPKNLIPETWRIRRVPNTKQTLVGIFIAWKAS